MLALLANGTLRPCCYGQTPPDVVCEIKNYLQPSCQVTLAKVQAALAAAGSSPTANPINFSPNVNNVDPNP